MERKILSQRLKNNLSIKADKFINTKSIFKVIAPVALSIFLIIIILVFAIQSSYSIRTIQDSEDIPEELSTAVVVIRLSDLKEDNGLWNTMLEESVDLYNSRKAKQIYVIPLNDENQVNLDVIKINKYLVRIPENRSKIANLNDSVYDICGTLKEDFQVEKGILLTYENVRSRIAFLCNSEGIVMRPYNVESDNYADSRPRILETISDIFYFLDKVI